MNSLKSIAVIVICTLLMISCNREKNIPANQLFSEPGVYRSPNGKYVVEVSQPTENEIKYFMRDNFGGGQSPSSSFSTKYDLFLCWDDQSRLWSYHPQELVHNHLYGDKRGVTVILNPDKLSNSQIAGWDAMPSEFAKVIPDNIREIYEKTVVDGTRNIPIAEELLDELLNK